MTAELWEPLLLIVIGGVFAVHCFRAARRELRSGIADGGRLGIYRREEPGFWPVIVLTFAASVMGVCFFIFGVALGIESFLVPTAG